MNIIENCNKFLQLWLHNLPNILKIFLLILILSNIIAELIYINKLYNAKIFGVYAFRMSILSSAHIKNIYILAPYSSDQQFQQKFPKISTQNIQVKKTIMRKLIILLLTILKLATALISAKTDWTYFRNNTKLTILSLSTEAGIDIQILTNQTSCFAYVKNIQSFLTTEVYTDRLRILPSIDFCSYQIRGCKNNQYNISQNYLIFSNLSLMYINKNINPVAYIYNISQYDSSYLIVESIFTSTNKTMVLLAKFQSLLQNKYVLIFVEYDGSVTVPYYQSLQVNHYSVYREIHYHEGQIFILFTDLIQVYSGNSSLIFLKQIVIAFGNTQSPSISLQNDLLAYCISSTCKLLNITDNYFEFQQIFLQKFITDVALSFPYVIIIHEGEVVQYDIQAQLFMGSLTENANYNQAKFITKEYFISYRRYPSAYNTTFYYQIDDSYNCDQSTQCTECINGYDYNETAMVCTRSGNFHSETKLSTVISYVAIAVSATSSRLTPAFISLAVFYLDDISYYNFHHTEYPQFFKSTLSYFNIINVIRLDPFIFDFFEVVTNDSIAKQPNYQYWSLLKPFHKNNPTGVYFAYSAQDTYKANFLLNALVFLASKVVLFLFHIIRKNFKVFKGFYGDFSATLVWWSLLVMVMESNVMKLTFDCFIQMKFTSYFDFSNKINSVACVFTLFLFVFYCCAVYPLCFRYCKNKHSQIFLVRTKYKVASYFAEPLCSISRNFFRAAAQAVFIQCYSSQILALACTDFVFLFLLVFFRKCFLNNLVFLGALAVAAAYFVIDLVLCLNNRKLISLESASFETFLYYSVIALACSILGLSGTVFLVRLNTARKYLFSNNKVEKLKPIQQRREPQNKNTIMIPVELLGKLKFQQQKTIKRSTLKECTKKQHNTFVTPQTKKQKQIIIKAKGEQCERLNKGKFEKSRFR